MDEMCGDQHRGVIFFCQAVASKTDKKETTMSQALYVFDLDNTLIDGDSSTLFSRFLVREGYVSDPDYLLHEERLMLDYARGRWISTNMLR
jgi:hypothetical protein